jgi:2,3-bisphosphoglycerate-dependent phosphoglycerate mutase
MKLVLLRHGQSEWNKENRFTGWTDVDLTPIGMEQAKAAGQLLKAYHFDFDVAYTSFLKRAIRTTCLVLDELDLMWIPVQKTWRLNERHYGALQGLNKEETAQKVGTDQVHQWRRSFAVRPPLLESSDRRNPVFEAKYQQLSSSEIPLGESLEDTIHRLLPYWSEEIWPQLIAKRKVLIVAHENSLRGIVKKLEKMSDKAITEFELPTGQPLVYTFNEQAEITDKYYLTKNRRNHNAAH